MRYSPLTSPNGHHHEQEEYDRERTEYLESRGYKVVRFWNKDVMRNTDTIIKAMMDELATHGEFIKGRSSPSLQDEK